MYKPMLIFAPLVVAALIPSTPLAPLPAETTPLDYFPAETLAFAELNGTGSWLNRAHIDALVDLAQSQGILGPKEKKELRGALDFARLFVGGDPVDLAGTLTAGGIAAGLLRGDGDTAWGLVFESADAAALDDSLARAFTFLEDKFDAHGLLDEPHGTYRGADYWNLGDELAVGRSGRTLAIASSTETLQRLVDEAADDEPGLAGRSDFKTGRSAELELWLDRAGLSAFANELGEKTPKLDAFVNAAHLPEVQFLLGPGLADLGSAQTITAQLDLDASGLAFELVGHAPESHTGLEPTTAAPTRSIGGQNALATGMLFRDAAAIVNRSNELFAPEMQPKFSKALGDLALLFGGMELDEELLPAIDPWIEFTVQPMDFADAPLPALALPGAAVVLRVDPSLKDTLVAGFQTTIGIANTDRAQAGKHAFTLGLALVGDVLITSGHMPRPAAGAAVDNDYNLAPAAAWVETEAGSRFVLGTHEAIVRDLVQELEAGQASSESGATTHERLELDGDSLAELVQTSSDYLAMQAVLDEGKTFDEATADIDGLVRLIDLFRSAALHVDYPKSGNIRFGIELAFDEPLDLDSTRTAGESL